MVRMSANQSTQQMPTSTGTKPDANNVVNFLTNQYLDDLANIGNGFRIKQTANPSQATTREQINH